MHFHNGTLYVNITKKYAVNYITGHEKFESRTFFLAYGILKCEFMQIKLAIAVNVRIPLT